MYTDSSVQSADFINIAFHKSKCIHCCREVSIIHHVEVSAATILVLHAMEESGSNSQIHISGIPSRDSNPSFDYFHLIQNLELMLYK
jgi:hypothetical protein